MLWCGALALVWANAHSGVVFGLVLCLLMVLSGFAQGRPEETGQVVVLADFPEATVWKSKRNV